MDDDEYLARLAREAGEALQEAGLVAVTAESCTGGWIAKCLTDVAGSSGWFDRAFITYSNEAKVQMLGVPAAVIDDKGAVSEPTVRAMAAGALDRAGADVCVAVSGIAGPGGGSDDKPVGTVWLAWARRDGARLVLRTRQRLLAGDRGAVRRETVALALNGLIAVCKE